MAIPPQEPDGTWRVALSRLYAPAIEIRMNDMNKKMAKGAAWMVSFKFVERSIGLISTIVLARLLVPEDFGLVALAMAVIAVLELLGAFSFDVVLIQKQHADRTYYDTAWTFNVIVGVASAAALVLLAHPVSTFYEDVRLESIMYLLALSPLVDGMQNIGVVAFRKEMQFHKEFVFLLTKKLISFTVTLALAFWLQNYWALIVGVVTGRLASTALSYWVHPFRPGFSLSKRAELFRFSFWLFMTNVANFVTNRVPDFVVGKISGAHALGLFTIAYEVSNMPTTELVAPINRAVFPGYSKLSDNVRALREGYLNVIGLIGLFAFPAALGVAATGAVFVPLVLGDKWLDSIVLIEVLAFYGLLNAVEGNTGSVYLAQGKPKINAYLVFALNAIRIPAVIVGANIDGAYGAACGILLASAIMVPVNLTVVFRCLQMPAMDYIRVMWRSMSAGLIMFFVVVQLKAQLGVTDHIGVLFIHLISLVACGALTYVLSLLLLWTLSNRPQGAETAVLVKVSERVARWRRA